MKQRYVGAVPVTAVGLRWKPGDELEAPPINHPDFEEIKKKKTKSEAD